MEYEGAIYRPPSEAYSLLIQVTIGCSHNKCTFCYMYRDKKFRIRSMDEIRKDLIESSKKYKHRVKRIFLCDGNAFVLKTEQLKEILYLIKELFPNCERVGAYAAPHDILRKTSSELKELEEAGLKIAYFGLESGSDHVLENIRKGVTQKQMIECAKIIKPSKIKFSVMVITGLGGQELWEEHADETVKALNEMQPDYLGLLTLRIYQGTPLYDEVEKGDFELLTPKQIVYEMHRMVKGLELQDCFFSSIHASNYINLRGRLSDDKDRLMEELDFYLDNEDMYRPEMFRGL